MSTEVATGRAGSGRRRTFRDWFVDIGVFLVSVAFSLAVAGERVATGNIPDPAWLFDVDQIIGVLGCGALWIRRRRPVELAVALIALSTFSELVAGAMLAALFTVAVHRLPRTTAAVFGLSVIAAIGYVVLRPEPDTPRLLLLLLGVAIQTAAVGWGLFIHHRRQLILSLRERAVRAEAEARLRAEQAQHRTREAIAREMHDVLGHRLSLLSVHAGALEYHPGAPADEVARAARVIRESAHQALQDLRQVIGVLRAPVGELPHPTFTDVRRLTDESVSAGMRVELRQSVDGTPPEPSGRTAYRIVQEALTNARKHAAGAEVSVCLAGAAGESLTVEVSNNAPAESTAGRPPSVTGPAPRTRPGTPSVTPSVTPTDAPSMTRTGPGSAASDVRPGQGLVGLAERVALAGGRIEHGPTAAGGWRVFAWLPWPPADDEKPRDIHHIRVAGRRP